MQRNLRNRPTHSGRMQNASRNSVYPTPQPSSADCIQEHLHSIWTKSRWETPEKVVENERDKILWDFKIQMDKQVFGYQPDIMIVDKDQKTAMIIDVSVPSDSNIRKKEYEKQEKYQGLKGELNKMWKVKATVILAVLGALRTVTPKLEECLQQIPGATSELSVQKSAMLGTAKMLRRTLKLPGLW
ncbi:uncharacterized protein LOC143804564 [Ranitomeya variabilis]|uniref:uncharacterized protein LOC143804564 n=1 Tax=Ranitomeya variabilis TaxID=490064 RepID=UPI004056C86F